jgi:hypothetical protein
VFIRKRNKNWSMERAIYRPAIKDVNGTTVTHAVRTTEYIGSIKEYARFANLPDELIEKLSEEEKVELREALKCNEPRQDMWLSLLCSTIRCAASEIKACAEASSADAAKKKLLESTMKGIDEAWAHFFTTAQDHGLKRRARRPTKVKTQPGAGSTTDQS